MEKLVKMLYANWDGKNEIDFCKHLGHKNRTRVNKCQAYFWTYHSEYGEVKLLFSYGHLVAVYIESTDTLYSIGRFSMTTYSHIRKFRDKYLPSMYKTRQVNLELVNWFK